MSEEGGAVVPGERYRRLTTADGQAFEAYEANSYLTVTDAGLVYLHTGHVDLILNGVDYPKYEHDGFGGLLLLGNFGAARLTLDRARTRFEPIEAWRRRMAQFPAQAEQAELCLASLMDAIERAERYLARQAQAAAVADPPAASHLPAMRDEDPDGVPLQHYLDHHPGAGVRFHCRECPNAFDLPLAVVLGGLKSRGDGDERTGIRAIARLTRKPCPRCGGRRFETRPAFPAVRG